LATGLCAVAPEVALADEPASQTIPAASAETDLVNQVLDLRGLSQLSLEQLMDLPVVTASGKAEERSLSAANVFIVSRSDIQRHGYKSLGEMLRRVPGMYLVNDYVNYSVGVREVTGGYRGGTRIVKIMIDGFPISFRPDLEAFLGPEFIPVEAIERVEIAKGPLSALYGANAFLATVNVITREPEDREVEVAQRYYSTQGNAGWGTSALATHSGLDTSLLLSMSFDRIDRSGVQAVQTYQYQTLGNVALLEPTRGDLAHPMSLFGRFDYHHDDIGDFTLEGGRQELDAKAEFQLASLVTHRSRINLINDWANLAWSRKAGPLRLRAHAGVSRGEPKSDYLMFLTGNPLDDGGLRQLYDYAYRPQFDYEALNLLSEASYEFGPWLQADVGIDSELRDEGVLYFRQVSFDQAGREPFDERDVLSANSILTRNYRQVGSYLQLHSAPIPAVPDFRLTGAARADWIDFGPVTYNAQTSFRGAVAYRFTPGFTTKLIGGRAFQTPSGTLLYAHGGFGSGANVQGTERLENPRGLDPQVVTSLELVIAAQVASFASVEASVFYQDLRDAIRFNEGGNLIVAKNSGTVDTVGGELQVTLKFDRLKPYAALSLSRQLSYELTRDLAGLTSFSGSPSMFPRLFGYAGVDVDLLDDMLFLNAELWWAGERGASQANFYRNDTQVYSISPCRPRTCRCLTEISARGSRSLHAMCCQRTTLSRGSPEWTSHSRTRASCSSSGRVCKPRDKRGGTATCKDRGERLVQM
jgi:iron complex outermembrane receptor protein